MRMPRLGAMLAVLLVAGCSSLPMGGGASTATRVDALASDVAGALYVLDLPQTLEPVPESSSIAVSLRSASGEERQIAATLRRADPGELAGLLPPPADSHNYYLLGLDAADQETLRAAQAETRSQAGGASITIRPALCRTGTIDPNRTTFSAMMVTPGGVAHLVRNAPVAVHSGGEVPPCAGHSG